MFNYNNIEEFRNEKLSKDGSEAIFIKNIVEKFFDSIEGNDGRVSIIWLGKDGLQILQKLRSIFDETTHWELHKVGLFGALFGANIKISDKIPNGYGIAYSDFELENNNSLHEIENVNLKNLVRLIDIFAICKKCNFENEYMNYQENYICYNCRN